MVVVVATTVAVVIINKIAKYPSPLKEAYVCARPSAHMNIVCFGCNKIVNKNGVHSKLLWRQIIADEPVDVDTLANMVWCSDENGISRCMTNLHTKYYANELCVIIIPQSTIHTNKWYVFRWKFMIHTTPCHTMHYIGPREYLASTRGNCGFVDTFTGAIKIPKCQNTEREQPFKMYNLMLIEHKHALIHSLPHACGVVFSHEFVMEWNALVACTLIEILSRWQSLIDSITWKKTTDAQTNFQ